MNSYTKKILTAGSLVLGATALQASVSMDFTNMLSTTDMSGTLVGDVWRATNVVTGGYGGITVDALFTIKTTNMDENQFTFATTENARGDDARVRFSNITGGSLYNKFVTIEVSFVNQSNGEAVSFGAGELYTQFDDLDSEPGVNLADYAGVQTSDFTTNVFASNTLLEADTALVSGSTVGILQGDGTSTPWNTASNVSDTGAIAQSPVTAGFTITGSAAAAGKFVMALGVTGTQFGSRHIDIDMTPDFTIVPEPSTYALLLGAVAAFCVISRRRV